MKVKSGVFMLLTGACFTLPLSSFAQTETPPASQTTVQMQDATRLREAERLKEENKAIAKETGRVNREATMAARDAKRAARAERKAQNDRVDANAKARKAAITSEKSKRNNL